MGSGGRLIKDKQHTEMSPHLFCKSDHIDHDLFWVRGDGPAGGRAASPARDLCSLGCFPHGSSKVLAFSSSVYTTAGAW